MSLRKYRAKWIAVGILLCLGLAGLCLAKERSPDAFARNKQLGRGVNLGNALDAPFEGAWGVRLEADYFRLIKAAGFNSVRIPVRFSAHTAKKEPYTIDPTFLKRADWAVKNALSRGLFAILDMHHYEEIHVDPAGHKQRYLAMWEQIAEHFKDHPAELMFELLNEPCKDLKAEIWNDIIKEVLPVVRKSNPDRTILIGPVHWNNIDYLSKLSIPAEDRNIIATCHYYSPFHFTHQGASWIGEESKKWLGTTWTASPEQKQAVIRDFDKALTWAEVNKRPIHIGEFGAYSKADSQSRARWTAFIARQAEKRKFSWAYWEFCAGFGVYDPIDKSWRKGLLESLIPPSKE